MTPEEQQNLLRELIAAQAKSPFLRLVEATVYSDMHSAAELSALERIGREAQRDLQALVEALIAEGGVPGPLIKDIHSADFHYSRIDVLMPRILADQERIAAVFDAARARLDDEMPAARLITDVAGRNRAHAEYVRKLTNVEATG